jgi:spore maturation protein A
VLFGEFAPTTAQGKNTRMLNKVWFALLLIGIAYGFGRATFNEVRGPGLSDPTTASREQNTGTAPSPDSPGTSQDPSVSSPADRRGLKQMGKDLNAAALDAAETSVTICIGLIGMMALWLGLLNVAKDAGLVDALARMLQPLMRWLFPEIPDGHPAQGAMLMNFSANMLGLDNAATPMGLKAMKELQTLNPDPDTATNSMALFLAINTSNVTIIPFTIIGYRQLRGSLSPAEPIFGILLTTTVATIVAIVVTRYLQRLPRYAATNPLAATAQGSARHSPGEPAEGAAERED